MECKMQLWSLSRGGLNGGGATVGGGRKGNVQVVQMSLKRLFLDRKERRGDHQKKPTTDDGMGKYPF